MDKTGFFQSALKFAQMAYLAQNRVLKRARERNPRPIPLSSSSIQGYRARDCEFTIFVPSRARTRSGRRAAPPRGWGRRRRSRRGLRRRWARPRRPPPLLAVLRPPAGSLLRLDCSDQFGGHGEEAARTRRKELGFWGEWERRLTVCRFWREIDEGSGYARWKRKQQERKVKILRAGRQK
jgi:hypothetical protein